MELAQSDLIWIAESDDYADSAFLATLVPLLRNHPQAGFAYCQSWRVDSDGHVNGTLEDWTDDLDPRRWKEFFVNRGLDECKEYLILKNTVPNASAVLLRKSMYLKSGGGPVGMRLAGDWMVWANSGAKSACPE